MMHQGLKSALLAGLLSSGLFILVFGVGLGFLFMFLPTLPLFYAGLGVHPRVARDAALAGAVLIGLLSGLPAVLLYLLFLAMPTVFMCQKSLLVRNMAGQPRQWYPIGNIIIALCLWGCGLVAAITLYFWGQDGGLPAMLAHGIREAFSELQDSYGDVIDTLAKTWSFLIFPVTLWLWCIMLYAHGWLAHRMLAKKGVLRRPDFTVWAFTIPSWMLSLLAICALASLIGSPSMQFLGKASLISLMLPYFFLGAASLRESSAAWPNGRFFMFFVYFMVFTQLWPALILSALGLWQQIKHLSAGESSFRK